jgi:hypothetical protein
MSFYLCFSFLNLDTILLAVLAIHAFRLFCYVIHGNVLRFFNVYLVEFWRKEVMCSVLWVVSEPNLTYISLFPWLTKWHWDRFSSKVLWFSPIIIIPAHSSYQKCHIILALNSIIIVLVHHLICLRSYVDVLSSWNLRISQSVISLFCVSVHPCLCVYEREPVQLYLWFCYMWK